MMAMALFTNSVCLAQANPALEGYADHATFAQQVKTLDESELVTAKSIGLSAGGREIWALTIGQGEVDRHPAIALVGSTEGGNLVGAEIAMRMAQKLVADAKEKPEVAAWLNRFTVYVIPRPEPDSLQHAFQGMKRVRAGNDTPTDDDRDFSVGEDPAEDLDGDGWITQMRIEDPTGAYIVHPNEPRLLVLADVNKQERGKYRLLTEGIDNDQDGQWNEDGSDGEVFERNFPHGYKPFVTGSGNQAASAPETRAIIDFLCDLPNVAVVYNFAHGENLLHPPKANPQAEQSRMKTTVLQADIPTLEFLSSEYKRVFKGTEGPSAAAEAAGFSNWSYFQYGRITLTARGWMPTLADLPKPEEAKEGEKKEEKPADDGRETESRKWLQHFAAQKREAFSNWAKVEHPDFPGKVVEVGGFRPFYQTHPVAGELEGMAAKHGEFVRKLTEYFPVLSLEGSKAESLGGGVIRITMKARNTGMFPTMTEMGRIAEEPYPLQAKVVGLPADVKWLVGSERTRVVRLEGLKGEAEQVWLVRVGKEVPAQVEIVLEAPSLEPVKVTLPVKAE